VGSARGEETLGSPRGGVAAKGRAPAVDEVVEYDSPVASFVALTSAPGRIAPVWSVTMPLMLPRKVCAAAVLAVTRTTRTAASARIVSPLSRATGCGPRPRSAPPSPTAH